ncbi:MAG: sigma-70 family RNA polymerase sigma factor [Myxococcales bacterium]|nr:sigma-70 family RNA polymerase sigma factor [Myxococcales bacterium]MCB9524830.1 sigma-70 family RNA polymerase sigma factor [Myxococcales bacterium]
MGSPWVKDPQGLLAAMQRLSGEGAAAVLTPREWAALYDAVQGMVSTRCTNLPDTVREQAADDLLQRLLRGLSVDVHLATAGQAVAYLRTGFRNRCIDLQRRRAREVGGAALDTALATRTAPDGAEDGALLDTAIADLLARLPALLIERPGKGAVLQHVADRHAIVERRLSLAELVARCAEAEPEPHRAEPRCSERIMRAQRRAVEALSKLAEELSAREPPDPQGEAYAALAEYLRHKKPNRGTP